MRDSRCKKNCNINEVCTTGSFSWKAEWALESEVHCTLHTVANIFVLTYWHPSRIPLALSVSLGGRFRYLELQARNKRSGQTWPDAPFPPQQCCRSSSWSSCARQLCSGGGGGRVVEVQGGGGRLGKIEFSQFNLWRISWFGYTLLPFKKTNKRLFLITENNN